MRHLSLSMIAVATLAVADPATIAAQAKAVAEKALASVADSSGALVRLTPPFPSAWPPNGKAVIYAYAARFDPSLHDAERTSPPWARLRVEGGKVTLADADKTLGKSEPQGFRPIAKDHPLIAKRAAGEAALLAATAVPTTSADDVRAYYCAWASLNGVAAAHVRPHHSAFFTWLACPTK